MAVQDIVLDGFGSTGSVSLIVTNGFNAGVLLAATVADQPSNWNVKRKRRPYSLEDWESWVSPEEKIIEDGVLPVELKQQAEAAVLKVITSHTKDEGKQVLNAMEALRSYEETYKKAYKEAYNQEIVYQNYRAEIQNYRAEILRARRNRAIALLLLH